MSWALVTVERRVGQDRVELQCGGRKFPWVPEVPEARDLLKTVAIILAGGRGERLGVLTEERAKPAVPFAGKFRIIDFTLSNCVNSGVSTVAVITQYRPSSLNRHLGTGKAWDLDRHQGGLFVLHPYADRLSSEWYQGTADAVHRNLSFLEEVKARDALVLAGDHVYSMHYNEMLDFHHHTGADITVGVTPVPREETSRFGIVTLDDHQRVVDFREKPQEANSNLASMGIYVFRLEVLARVLEEDARRVDSSHDFGKDILPKVFNQLKVYGYPYRGFWRDVGTPESYWQSHMELIADLPQFNLYDPANPIHTKTRDWPPVKTGPWAQVSRSLVSDGCIINGVVRNSILSPGVYVEDGAVVEGSIILDNVFVGRRSYIHRCIVDKEAHIGAEAQLGSGEDFTPNGEETDLRTGLTMVGKRVRIPDRTRIGRNCALHVGVTEKDFTSDSLPSGASLRSRSA
ncbi:MAG: glucose-1-phosphate adenylyltransferase [Chloroflexi bacterium]|nr:glucose-1-phosphate adenylyltransferase [Chloroflexota bacterium]